MKQKKLIILGENINDSTEGKLKTKVWVEKTEEEIENKIVFAVSDEDLIMLQNATNEFKNLYLEPFTQKFCDNQIIFASKESEITAHILREYLEKHYNDTNYFSHSRQLVKFLETLSFSNLYYFENTKVPYQVASIFSEDPMIITYLMVRTFGIHYLKSTQADFKETLNLYCKKKEEKQRIIRYVECEDYANLAKETAQRMNKLLDKFKISSFSPIEGPFVTLEEANKYKESEYQEHIKNKVLSNQLDEVECNLYIQQDEIRDLKRKLHKNRLKLLALSALLALSLFKIKETKKSTIMDEKMLDEKGYYEESKLYYYNILEYFLSIRIEESDPIVAMYKIHMAMGYILGDDFIDDNIKFFNSLYGTDYDSLDDFLKKNNLSSEEEWKKYVVMSEMPILNLKKDI